MAKGRLYYSERRMLAQAKAGYHVAPAEVVALLERIQRMRGREDPCGPDASKPKGSAGG